MHSDYVHYFLKQGARRKECVVLHTFNISILEFLLPCLFKSLTLHMLKVVKPCVVTLPFLSSTIMIPILTLLPLT